MLREHTRPPHRFGVTRSAENRAHPPLCAPRGISRIRRAFFASAAESAARYGVHCDRVIVHLWELRQRHPRFRLRQVTNIDDLVHAIACVDESNMAWAELNSFHERGLVSLCRIPSDEITSTIMIRRFFSALRRRHQTLSALNSPSIRDYAGDRPLRTWLNERLNAIRASELHRGRVIKQPYGP